jgi:hypothetical protein
MTVLIAYAAVEAGLKTIVIDPDGYASARISGYVSAYSPSYFLYDAMKMDVENPSFHAQLVASAYGSALDLSFDQESVLGSACNQLALEEGIASPLALAERMGGEELGGHASRRLRDRLNGLVSLSVVGEEGVIARLLSGSAILDLHQSMTPEAAELTAALLIAKLLAVARSTGKSTPDMVVLLQANRLFRTRPVFRKNLRLLSTFVTAPMGKVLSSDTKYYLEDGFLDAAPVSILSGDTENGPRADSVLGPGMFALRDLTRGSKELFFPRIIERRAGTVTGGVGAQSQDSGLAGEILEAISTFGNSTRQSLISYLSTGRSKEGVEREIDRLIEDGRIEAGSRRLRADSPNAVIRLTPKGKDSLKEVR